MEKIAFICQKQSFRVESLCNVLKRYYEIIIAHDENEIMDLLEESFNDLSVLIVDHPASVDYINNVFDYIKDNSNYMFSLPVLVLTDLENMNDDDKYLNNPVVDIIFCNDTEEVILRRVKNAVTLASSASFDTFTEMLKVLPSLIYLKD